MLWDLEKTSWVYIMDYMTIYGYTSTCEHIRVGGLCEKQECFTTSMKMTSVTWFLFESVRLGRLQDG